MADDPEVALAETFAEVARTLLAEDDLDATLDKICELVVEVIDACDSASISLVRHRKVDSRSSTDDVPRTLDEIQSETQEGPCVDAITDHEVFVTGALSEESRWPEFSARAHAATGIESVLSLRLFADRDTFGALNLYSRRRDAFDDHDIAVGAVFATHAAVAVDAARREEGLEGKASSRDIIGMAKGLIMARQGVTSDEAFDVLRRASQRMNVKLREVAARMVDGSLDRQELPPPSSSG